MAMPVTRYMVKRRRPGNSGLKIAAATDYTGITAQDSFASVLASAMSTACAACTAVSWMQELCLA